MNDQTQRAISCVSKTYYGDKNRQGTSVKDIQILCSETTKADNHPTNQIIYK